jgi:hypothetical protein
VGAGVHGVAGDAVRRLLVAEGIGREEGWWGHLLQLAVAVLLAVGAWVRPRIGGPALILVGTLFVARMLVADGALAGMLARLSIVSVPLIVAGVFFALAGKASRPPSHR